MIYYQTVVSFSHPKRMNMLKRTSDLHPDEDLLRFL